MPILAISLMATTLLFGILFIDRSNYDLTVYLLPWYEHIMTEGRLASLHGNFTDYTPPYVYVLSIVTLTNDFLQPIVAIKLASMLFGLFGAYQVYHIMIGLRKSINYSLNTSIIFYTLPEVSLNNIVWGQSDVMYVSFLLAFTRYILQRRRSLAMIMYGIAISFKPQSLFIAPFVGYLFLYDVMICRRFISAAWDLMLTPITYMIMMIPALLAGRSIEDVFIFYREQYNYSPRLNWAAANPYVILELFRQEGENLSTSNLTDPSLFQKLSLLIFQYQDMLGIIGLIFAFAVCGLLVVLFYRSTKVQYPELLIYMLTVSALVVPFITPKMHERYFIAAGVFAFLLACTNPKKLNFIICAICLQTSAMFPYMRFLFQLPDNKIISYVMAMTLTTIGLLLILPGRRNS